MLKTLQLNNKVIGMYLSDHGNVYLNGDNTAKTTFITSEFNSYIPILNLIEVNHRQELTFANGVNKNEEIVTYNRGVSGRGFSDAVIRKNKLDVSVNDLFVGPITIFLNFTNYNLTVVTDKEFRKTFVPIENTHLEEFRGKMVIVNLHTLNTPKNIQNITGCTNYLETLQERFKNRNAPNIDEMQEVIKYAADKWGEAKFLAAMSQSNSIKVATVVEVCETEFIKDKNDSLFLRHQDLVITLDNIVEAIDHPATTNAVLSNRELTTDIRKNSFTCYLVDNDDKIADRYVNIAGVVKKLAKLKDHNLVDGLYMITVDHEGKVHNDSISKLEELDANKYVYKSAEEANIGADLRVQYRDNVEVARTEMEVNKIDKLNDNIETKALFDVLTRDAELRRQEHAAEMERVRNEVKLLTDLLKANDERQTIQEKRSLSRFQNDDDVRAIVAKRDFESFRYDIDRRQMSNKIDYESIKYERDTFVEGLKTMSAVAGLAATGYLIYSKLGKAS